MNETISKSNSYVREDLINPWIQIICLVLIARDTLKYNSNHPSSRTTRVLVDPYFLSQLLYLCAGILLKRCRDRVDSWRGLEQKELRKGFEYN